METRHTITEAPPQLGLHPLIRLQVVTANDAPNTTPEMRAELVRAGETGILDTWWVPDEVIVAGLACDRDVDLPSQFDRTMAMLRHVSAWKLDKAKPNLAGAILRGANLTDADLTDANLRGADLADANLRGAKLAGANLTYAYLAGANLAGAYLTGANLTGVYGTPISGAPDGWKLDNGFWIIHA